MTDRPDTSQTTPWERGYQAFHDGAAISVCPSDLTLPEYEEYRKGWTYADEEQRVGYMLGQSLKTAGLTNV